MKKIPVWKNVVLILSTLVILVIATLAWFYDGPNALIGELFQNVGEASFIQISSDNGNTWSEDLNVEIGVNKNFKEISGDGIKLFAPVYDAVEKPTGGYAVEIVSFEEVKDDAYYYEQVFSFRSDATQGVYLDSESFVMSASDNAHIDGAIRVAFIELDENDNETLRCIWAPNSKVQYSSATNSFTDDGNVEDNYYYQKSVTPIDPSTLTDDSTNPHMAKIPTTDYTNGYLPKFKFMWSSGNNLPENAPSLLNFELGEGESLATKRLKVKVWLEGYDRECVSLLGGQSFTMKFKFIADKGV